MPFFARSAGGSALSTLKVEVLFELATGQVASLPIGLAIAGTHRSWQPTLPMTVVANLLPLLPGWTIDDVYVDPKRRS